MCCQFSLQVLMMYLDIYCISWVKSRKHICDTFDVRKSITVEIKKLIILLFCNESFKISETSLCHHGHSCIDTKPSKILPFTNIENGSVSSIWRKYFAGSMRHNDKSMKFCYKEKLPLGIISCAVFLSYFQPERMCIFSKFFLVTFSTSTGGNAPC